jgi:hypothetical protein
VASWEEFERAEPEMAEVGLQELTRFRATIAYLATVQADGSPQVHPVCPVLASGQLYVSIGHTSPKLSHLRRDGRYMLHCLPGDNDAEFSVRGRTTEANDPVTRERVVAAARDVGLNVKDSEIIFRFDIERADTAYWENVGQPDTHAIRRKWLAPAQIG